MCFSLHDNDSDDEVMATDGELQSILLSPGGGDKNYLHKKGFFAISQQGANTKGRAANNQKKTQSNKQACVKLYWKITPQIITVWTLISSWIQLFPMIENTFGIGPEQSDDF